MKGIVSAEIFDQDAIPIAVDKYRKVAGLPTISSLPGPEIFGDDSVGYIANVPAAEFIPNREERRRMSRKMFLFVDKSPETQVTSDRGTEGEDFQAMSSVLMHETVMAQVVKEGVNCTFSVGEDPEVVRACSHPDSMGASDVGSISDAIPPEVLNITEEMCPKVFLSLKVM